MTAKIRLEIEELEERIAPHCTPLGGDAAVGAQTHGTLQLCLPNDVELPVPHAAHFGIVTALNAGQ